MNITPSTQRTSLAVLGVLQRLLRRRWMWVVVTASSDLRPVGDSGGGSATAQAEAREQQERERGYLLNIYVPLAPGDGPPIDVLVERIQ